MLAHSPRHPSPRQHEHVTRPRRCVSPQENTLGSGKRRRSGGSADMPAAKRQEPSRSQASVSLLSGSTAAGVRVAAAKLENTCSCSLSSRPAPGIFALVHRRVYHLCPTWSDTLPGVHGIATNTTHPRQSGAPGPGLRAVHGLPDNAPWCKNQLFSVKSLPPKLQHPVDCRITMTGHLLRRRLAGPWRTVSTSSWRSRSATTRRR